MLSGVPGAAVCFDAGIARILIGGGLAVVLCGTDAASIGAAARSLRDRAGGRIAVMVGDPIAAPDVAAAVGMARELFGTEPTVVDSVDQARWITGPAKDSGSPMG